MENVITQESSKAIEFNYYLPVNIVFGSGKVNKAGELAKPYGKNRKKQCQKVGAL